jgi:hypothetical protein
VTTWTWLGAAALAGACGWLLDRALLAAERRGWIYYRKRRASPGTAASAALDVHALLEPSRRHVVGEQRAVRHEDDGQGEPPPVERRRP